MSIDSDFSVKTKNLIRKNYNLFKVENINLPLEDLPIDMILQLNNIGQDKDIGKNNLISES